MSLNFDVKSQKILGSHTPAAGLWSIPFEFDTEDAEMLSKRGKLYIVADFKAKVDVDLQLASKIIIDAIKEHYYGDLEGTPLQALENAVLYGKEKLQQTASSNNAIELNFDIVACVVWGSVLYLAQSGQTASLVIRNGEISDISHKTSGEVMTTSGILENNDVVIIATKAFEEKFKDESLVEKLGSVEDLINVSENSPSLSAVVISFRKSIASSAKDLVGIMGSLNILKSKKSSKIKEYPALKSVESPPILPKEELDKSITSIDQPLNLNVEPKDANHSQDFELKPPSKKGKKVKNIFIGAGVLGILALLSFGVFTVYNNYTNRPNDDISIVVGESFEGKLDILNQNNAVVEDYQKLRDDVYKAIENGSLEYYDLLSTIDKKIDELAGQSTASSENSLYDFRAKSDNSYVNKINLFKNDILISDFGAKQAYLLTEGDEVSIKDILAGEEYLITTTDDTNIYLIEKNKVFVGSSAENLVEYALDKKVEGINDAYVYFGNIYAVTDTEILKFEKLGDSYKVTNWSNIASPAKSLIVDGNIFITNNDGIIKYYTGEKEDYVLSGTEDSLKDSFVSDSVVSENLTILASGGLYSFSRSTGEFVEKTEVPDLVSNPTSFVQKDKILYVSAGSKVFKISLEKDE